LVDNNELYRKQYLKREIYGLLVLNILLYRHKQDQARRCLKTGTPTTRKMIAIPHIQTGKFFDAFVITDLNFPKSISIHGVIVP